MCHVRVTTLRPSNTFNINILRSRNANFRFPLDDDTHRWVWIPRLVPVHLFCDLIRNQFCQLPRTRIRNPTPGETLSYFASFLRFFSFLLNEANDLCGGHEHFALAIQLCVYVCVCVISGFTVHCIWYERGRRKVVQLGSNAERNDMASRWKKSDSVCNQMDVCNACQCDHAMCLFAG